MSQITTHILDTSLGKPASGVNIILDHFTSGSWHQLSKGITDNDGRIKNFLPIDKKTLHLHCNDNPCASLDRQQP